MANSQSLVSVIIPVLNGEAYIACALESIYAQSWQNIEIIVVDDGSTDNTATLVQHRFPQVRYFFQPNSGIGAARNRGLEQTKGDYIAFLDADDYWLEHKLQLQMKIFQEHPQTDIVFTHIRQFHSPELSESEKQALACPDIAMPAELPSTLLCPRRIINKVGMFETHWKVGGDISWIMRARALKLHTVILPDVLYMRRLHRKNNGNTKSTDFSDRLSILKTILDRRRNNSLSET